MRNLLVERTIVVMSGIVGSALGTLGPYGRSRGRNMVQGLGF
jgi:hypothetical protein